MDLITQQSMEKQTIIEGMVLRYYQISIIGFS